MEQEDVKPNIKPELIEAQLPGKYTSGLWYSIPLIIISKVYQPSEGLLAVLAMLPVEIDYPDARHVSVKPEPLDDPSMVKQEVLPTSVPSLSIRRKQHLRIWLHSLIFSQT